MDLIDIIHRQIAFSENTFGPTVCPGDRSTGLCDHIRKELTEIENNPTDIEEWIDVIILGIDGAWRAGHTPEQIVEALVAKQKKNEGRQWPDWRTADPGKAIGHIRSNDLDGHLKLSIYLDVEPWMRDSSHFFPFTDCTHKKSITAIRYRFDVGIPDPLQPDVVTTVNPIKVE